MFAELSAAILLLASAGEIPPRSTESVRPPNEVIEFPEFYFHIEGVCRRYRVVRYHILDQVDGKIGYESGAYHVGLGTSIRRGASCEAPEGRWIGIPDAMPINDVLANIALVDRAWPNAISALGEIDAEERQCLAALKATDEVSYLKVLWPYSPQSRVQSWRLEVNVGVSSCALRGDADVLNLLLDREGNVVRAGLLVP